ncbi:MAG: ATP-binding protein [Acidobacteria bacterium]|nr:ATP-binding protein [Acidobacteriota bacterium]
MTEQDVREITVPAALGEVPRVRAFIHDYVAGLGLGEEDRVKIELSLHEICVNIALYAYPEGRPGEMTVRAWKDGGDLFIEVRDQGAPFDPVRKKDPDLRLKLRCGTPGGLGVYFYKTLMDGLSYRRSGGRNVLTLRKAL